MKTDKKRKNCQVNFLAACGTRDNIYISIFCVNACVRMSGIPCLLKPRYLVAM